MIPSLTIFICFIFTTMVLIAVLIRTHLGWILKSVLIICSLISAFSFRFAYEESMGYPAEAKPPSAFKVLWTEVHEPVPYKGDQGAIYFWYQGIGEYTPRAIVLPYSKAQADKAQKAKQSIQSGDSVYMGDKSQEGNDNSDGDGQSDNSIMDFIPPPDTIPPKETDKPIGPLETGKKKFNQI